MKNTTNQSTAKVSTYKINVIGTNKNLKNLFSNVSDARSTLLALHNNKELDFTLPTEYKTILTKSRKDNDLYNKLVENTRLNKKGQITRWSFLQMLHRITK